MNSSLLVGVGRTDITPELGTALAGYPTQDRYAESVRDPLHATALVLVRNGVKAVLLSLDWILIEAEEVAEIRRLVHERTGIEPAHVTVSVIQSHSTPRTFSAFGWGEKDRDYVQLVMPRIIDAVAQAETNQQPVTVGIGTTHSDVGINRRQIRENNTVALGTNPWGPYDPIMTVLRFEGAHGPVAAIVHYGAHPTVFGGNSRVVSRDWPGVMVDRLEALTGATTLFINGAVGDVAPRTNSRGAVGDGDIALYETGARAAIDALAAYRSIKEFRDLDLAVLTKEIFLPYQPLADLETARRELAVAEPTKDRWGQAMCDYRHWQAVVNAHEGQAESGVVFTQTITRLGPVALVPFPGEPFSEIILRLRDYSPFSYTLAASTTNGSFGYFVTRESLHRGGYEVWVAKAYGAYILAENIDDLLIEANVRLLRELYASDGQAIDAKSAT
ncbi:MAG: neutral/alkaline non-lysosomal ceramidase N-terminal domain-containing protein [Chloroflexi bacterium]|nr:neutral/alkaline non-lysosomal ceramidase N-terminal domain-containing protein [Chloroflexota bacterium]